MRGGRGLAPNLLIVTPPWRLTRGVKVFKDEVSLAEGLLSLRLC